MRLAMLQAEWNAKIGTPCEFILLNQPNKRAGGFQQGVDFARVDPARGDQIEQRQQLRNMLLANGPRGTTPMTMRLAEIYRRIESSLPELTKARQRVMVVIVTDGLPTNEYAGTSTEVDRRMFIDILRRICNDLPVHIVIRLATEDHEVVEFFDRIDNEAELALEVLDDIESEAKEVCRKGNIWLTYSPLIQTIREGGTFVKIFDFIDERRLTTMEALLLAHLLLQEEGDDPPPVDPWKFAKFVEERVRKYDHVYEPVTQRMVPVIEATAFRMQVVPYQAWIPLPWARKGITPRIKGAWYKHPIAYLRGGRRRHEVFVTNTDLERASLEAGLWDAKAGAAGEDIVPEVVPDPTADFFPGAHADAGNCVPVAAVDAPVAEKAQGNSGECGEEDIDVGHNHMVMI